MEKFFCESRVKCLNVSSSPSSGKPLISRRTRELGIASVIFSSSGQKNALRPGEPLSKMSLVSAVRGALLGDGSDKPLDLLFFVHLGDANEQTIFQVRVPFFQRHSRD